MAKRLFHATNWTPTAIGDTSAMANSTYMGLKGGTTTQLINLLEVLINGIATTSAPTLLQVAFSSTIETTPAALVAPNSDGPMHPSTAALAAPPVTFTLSAAGPQRSALTSLGRLELGLNAFGGIMKWNPYTPDMALSILGNAASGGEVTLSAFTGGTVGAVSAHMIYEPL